MSQIIKFIWLFLLLLKLKFKLMNAFENFLYTIEDVKVIDKSIPYSLYKPLDLSVYNEELKQQQLNSSEDFENYIDNFLTETKSKVAFGGYNEKRQLYKRSTIFNDTLQEERNIHIGLDLWTTEKTDVLAALDGKVYGFKHNEGLGNYGQQLLWNTKLTNLNFILYMVI